MYCAEAHDAGTVDAFYGVKKPEAFAITGPERFGQSRPAWHRGASHTVIRRLSNGSTVRVGPYEKVVNGFLAESILT